MRRILPSLILFVCSCAFVGEKPEPATLTIIHTNDLHSHLEPLCDPVCLGGMPRALGFINPRTAKDKDALLLDAGDRFTGTLNYAFFKGRDMALLMNLADYTAMVLGNHEFDDGMDALENFVSMSSAPIIASNIVFERESRLSEIVFSSLVVERKGKRIGIIGLTTPETKILAARTDYARFLPVLPVVQAKLAEFKKAGADIVIVVSHIGFEADKELARTVPGINVIVGGHSHTVLPTYPAVEADPEGNPVFIVTAGQAGQYVGVLDIVVGADNKITSFEGTLTPMDDSVPENKEARAMVDSFFSEIKETSEEKIVFSENPLSFGNNKRCRDNCLLGEVFTDIWRESFPETQIFLINSGAFRRPLGKGYITFGQLLEAFPFDNKAVDLSLTGREITDMIQNAYDRQAILQPSGLKYEIRNGQAAEVKVLDNGTYAAIDPNKMYRVTVNDFMAKGGDGIMTLDRPYVLGKSLRNTLIDGLKSREKIAPVLEGRVQLDQLEAGHKRQAEPAP